MNYTEIQTLLRQTAIDYDLEFEIVVAIYNEVGLDDLYNELEIIIRDGMRGDE